MLTLRSVPGTAEIHVVDDGVPEEHGSKDTPGRERREGRPGKTIGEGPCCFPADSRPEPRRTKDCAETFNGNWKKKEDCVGYM